MKRDTWACQQEDPTRSPHVGHLRRTQIRKEECTPTCCYLNSDMVSQGAARRCTANERPDKVSQIYESSASGLSSACCRSQGRNDASSMTGCDFSPPRDSSIVPQFLSPDSAEDFI